MIEVYVIVLEVANMVLDVACNRSNIPWETLLLCVPLNGVPNFEM